ncbi:SDR family NAD(P)-dependent oxidoreductase [Rhizobium laguerreae]|uniref:SDR family NAD(P)-dependent oxidoreductase n=1 Tax=Rhizobium laguerreae TaxID=1076926 RepID=UPI001FEA7932|nr:SDR family oxidoreductase [Rhizobium laguerreae]
MMFEDLNGKAILITGASTGIGAAAAVGFARSGSRVAIHYNQREAEANTLAERIRQDGGVAEVVHGDLIHPAVATEVVNSAAEALGGLDVLVNNAGAVLRRAPFEELDDDLYQTSLNLNVASVIKASQAALGHFSLTHGGSIINVGSIAGVNGGGPGWGHYAGAKAYIHNLTKSMANALASRNVRVNAIAPGLIDTPFYSELPRERLEAAVKNIPMGRLGVAEDCVGPLLFLASPSVSGYVTGQIIHINGGQY